MDTWTDDEGINWISCDVFCVGDYGGAGSVGEANIRALEDREDSIVRYGAYFSRQLWLQDTPDNRDLIKELEDHYPLVDEEEHSWVEVEWEEEAWESYGKVDLLRTLPDELGEVVEDDLTDDNLWECYREAMEVTNSYPIMEYSGACLPINRIKEAFAQAVLSRLTRLA